MPTFRKLEPVCAAAHAASMVRWARTDPWESHAALNGRWSLRDGRKVMLAHEHGAYVVFAALATLDWLLGTDEVKV